MVDSKLWTDRFRLLDYKEGLCYLCHAPFARRGHIHPKSPLAYEHSLGRKAGSRSCVAHMKHLYVLAIDMVLMPGLGPFLGLSSYDLMSVVDFVQGRWRSTGNAQTVLLRLVITRFFMSHTLPYDISPFDINELEKNAVKGTANVAFERASSDEGLEWAKKVKELRAKFTRLAKEGQAPLAPTPAPPPAPTPAPPPNPPQRLLPNPPQRLLLNPLRHLLPHPSQRLLPLP